MFDSAISYLLLFMTPKMLISFLLGATLCLNASAQQNCSGQLLISDEHGIPLAGAHVLFFDADADFLDGLSSDTEGYICLDDLELEVFAKVHIQMLSYETLELSPESWEQLLRDRQVQLLPETYALDEVPILAYDSLYDASNTAALMEPRSTAFIQIPKSVGHNLAAGLKEPTRMVTNFAGVRSSDDITGVFSVRGNMPKAIAWQLDGIEVPTPMHYSTDGAATGTVTMMHERFLDRIDFHSSNFPINMNDGIGAGMNALIACADPDSFNLHVQAGFLGMQAFASGGFSEKSKASWMAAARYSTLALLGEMGMEIGGAVSGFKDINLKLDVPLKNDAHFSVLGIGGMSSIVLQAGSNAGIKETKSFDLGLLQIVYRKKISESISWRNSAVLSQGLEKYDADASALKLPDPEIWYFESRDKSLRLNSHWRWNNGNHGMEWGLQWAGHDYYLFEGENYPALENDIYWQGDDFAGRGSAYALWKYRQEEGWNVDLGLCYQRFFFNNSESWEPRFNTAYRFNNWTISYANGIYGRLESMGWYMNQWIEPNMVWQPNQNLGFTHSWHQDLRAQTRIADLHRVQVAVYHQYIFDVPVSMNEDNLFSALNYQWRYPGKELQQVGAGRNYGIEFSYQRSLSNQFFMLASQSLFRSKFRAADGLWRGSSWDAGFISNFSAGKFFKVGSEDKNRLRTTGRILYSGGYRLMESDFEERIGNTFRIDLRLAYTKSLLNNRSWTLGLDVQNATNRLNENIIDDIDPSGVLIVINWEMDIL